MLNPGGYAVWTDRETGRLLERDTITCAHCQRVVYMRPRDASSARETVQGLSKFDQGAEHDGDLGGFCRLCMKHICGPCSDVGTCIPFERKLEINEQAARLHRVIKDPDLKL